MKILMLTGEYPPNGGGIAGYTALLRDALQALDVQCTVVSEAGTNAEIGIDRWSWSLPRQVSNLAEDHAADIVHIQYQAGAFAMHPAVNLLPRLMRTVPVVTTFHDLRPPYLFPKAGRARFALMKRMARWSKAVIVSNAVDQRILSHAGIAAVRIPLGPSIPAPDSGIAPGQSVGFFGYPSRQKGFDLLLEAVSMIDDARRPEVLIVGNVPPGGGNHGYFSQPEVVELAKVMNVDVRWTGFLNPQQASNALAACGVIAFPFPAGATLRSSAMLAALQTDRPVLTTKPANIEDLNGIQDMPSLNMVDTTSVPALSDMIAALIATGQSVETGGLPESFRWDSIAARHTDVYRSIVNEQDR